MHAENKIMYAENKIMYAENAENISCELTERLTNKVVNGGRAKIYVIHGQI